MCPVMATSPALPSSMVGLPGAISRIRSSPSGPMPITVRNSAGAEGAAKRAASSLRISGDNVSGRFAGVI